MKKLLLLTIIMLPFSMIQGSITGLTLGAMLVGGSVYTGQQAYEEYKKTQSLKSSLFHGGKKMLDKIDQATDVEFDYGSSPDEMKKKKRQREFQRLLTRAEQHFDKYHKVYGWSLCSIIMLHIGLRFLLGSAAEQS